MNPFLLPFVIHLNVFILCRKHFSQWHQNAFNFTILTGEHKNQHVEFSFFIENKLLKWMAMKYLIDCAKMADDNCKMMENLFIFIEIICKFIRNLSNESLKD